MSYRITEAGWVQALARQLNESESYRRAARDYVGTVVFVVEPDEAYAGTACLYLAIEEGRCLDAGKIDHPYAVEAVLTVFAAYGTWRRVVEGQLDPIQGLMTRQLRIEGDILKLMRYPKAAMEMIASGTRVPTFFEPSG